MIENALATHPAFALAAAVGMPDAYAGELPVCYVALRADADATVEALEDHARRAIDERPAWPKHIPIVDAIPLTTVGKIYEPALRCDAAERVVVGVVRERLGITEATVRVVEGGRRGMLVRVMLPASARASIPTVQHELEPFLFEADVGIASPATSRARIRHACASIRCRRTNTANRRVSELCSRSTSRARAPWPVVWSLPSVLERPAEPALLPLVARQDAAATRACIERYGGLVWSLARRSSEGAADAEDAVQEIFIELWKSAARYDPSMGSELTFVAMVARRRLIDRRRRRVRRLDREPLPDVVIDPGAGDAASLSTEVGLVGKALDQLRPEQRQMLLMSTYDGRSHGEIAKALSVPLGTVKANIRRGLIAVRRALLGDAPDADGPSKTDSEAGDERT